MQELGSLRLLSLGLAAFCLLSALGLCRPAVLLLLFVRRRVSLHGLFLCRFLVVASCVDSSGWRPLPRCAFFVAPWLPVRSPCAALCIRGFSLTLRVLCEGVPLPPWPTAPLALPRVPLLLPCCCRGSLPWFVFSPPLLLVCAWLPGLRSCKGLSALFGLVAWLWGPLALARSCALVPAVSLSPLPFACPLPLNLCAPQSGCMHSVPGPQAAALLSAPVNYRLGSPVSGP